MLPVKLTLEGIYSYRERQTIDFTRLTEARLFGIFGPVGSGKSTILEAMIYAIYGTIDRLNNDVKYNVMNLQSDRLFVDFEFRALFTTMTSERPLLRIKPSSERS